MGNIGEKAVGFGTRGRAWLWGQSQSLQGNSSGNRVEKEVVLGKG